VDRNRVIEHSLMWDACTWNIGVLRAEPANLCNLPLILCTLVKKVEKHYVSGSQFDFPQRIPLN